MKAPVRTADLPAFAFMIAGLAAWVSNAPEASAGAVIYNTGNAATATIALGVNDLGHLNVTDPTGFFRPGRGVGATGITYIGLGDATSPGCLCEGWGVSGTVGGVAKSGYANVSSGTANLSLVSFASDAAAGTGSFATSTVELSDTPGFRVTQDYRAATNAPDALFVDTVTITNTTGSAITDLRYVRVMDWDVPPTEFNEFVTIVGTGTTTFLETSHDNGFASANPLAPSSPRLGGTLDVDFTDSGPADHGAYFKFNFGTLGVGESRTFSVYYGAAGTAAAVLAALASEGVELYSLGEQRGDPIVGTPATYTFAFEGVGGTPVIPTPEPASLALIGSGLIGLGFFVRRRRSAVVA